MREVVSKLIKGLLDRFEELRYRRATQGRFWLASEGVALVLVVGLLLGLGALAAVAVSQTDGETAHPGQSSPDLAVFSSRTAARTHVITETLKLNGETVRFRHRAAGGSIVVRTLARPGTTVQGFITLPSDTIFHTQTVTTKEVSTVTDVQEVTVTAPPETVTVFETITCKPKKC